MSCAGELKLQRCASQRNVLNIIVFTIPIPAYLYKDIQLILLKTYFILPEWVVKISVELLFSLLRAGTIIGCMGALLTSQNPCQMPDIINGILYKLNWTISSCWFNQTVKFKFLNYYIWFLNKTRQEEISKSVWNWWHGLSCKKSNTTETTKNLV